MAEYMDELPDPNDERRNKAIEKIRMARAAEAKEGRWLTVFYIMVAALMLNTTWLILPEANWLRIAAILAQSLMGLILGVALSKIWN